MTRKALLVDGPRAGARFDVEDRQRTLVLPVFLEAHLDSLIREPWDVGFETVTYNLHHGVVSWLDGRSITIGCVRPGKPALEDMIDVVLSDEAKEALS